MKTTTTVAAVLALAILTGCTSDQALRVASTLEVGYSHGEYQPEDALGIPSYADSHAIFFSIRPLAAFEPPTKVIVVQRKD